MVLRPSLVEIPVISVLNAVFSRQLVGLLLAQHNSRACDRKLDEKDYDGKHHDGPNTGTFTHFLYNYEGLHSLVRYFETGNG